MALIQGIGDDVMTLLFVMFIVLVVIMSWLSTNVREFTVPANLLVVERRSRRLYTTNFNGNFARVNNSSRLAPSLTTTTTTNPDVNRAEASSSQQQAGDVASSAFEQTRTGRSNELELVNEIVEQALVDNLLDGGFYSAEEIDLVQPTSSDTETPVAAAAAVASSPIASGSGEVVSSVNTTATFGDRRDEPASGEEPAPPVASQSSIAQSEVEEVSTLSTLLSESGAALADPINILIKFVNEREMRIQARPDDTILLIKKTYFSQEISNNQIVRFIYQGQFLNDKSTIKSYNIKDQTTIHCHIISKPSTGGAVVRSETTTTVSNATAVSTASSVRHRLNNRSSMVGLGHVTTLPVSSTAPAQEVAAAADAGRSAGSFGATTGAGMGANPAPTTGARSQTRLVGVTAIDLNSILLPLLAVVLAACWYFRINFKHFFSPLSTLVLIFLTFIYALFLFNNIHSSSALVANNLVITSRVLQSRRGGARPASSPVVPPTATVAPQAPVEQ